jgi:hypothetical protein
MPTITASSSGVGTTLLVSTRYNARGVHELADERWIAVKIEDDESIEEECSGSPHGTYPRSKVIEPALSLEHIIILSQP